jgi:hypothetical protein
MIPGMIVAGFAAGLAAQAVEILFPKGPKSVVKELVKSRHRDAGALVECPSCGTFNYAFMEDRGDGKLSRACQLCEFRWWQWKENCAGK